LRKKSELLTIIGTLIMRMEVLDLEQGGRTADHHHAVRDEKELVRWIDNARVAL
jgi:hypothetical protein